MPVVDVKIPELGESITDVVLTKWHKSDGDWVEKDEPIYEIESDKITTDVPSPESGVISTNAQAGAELEVGAVVATIDPKAQKPASSTAVGSSGKSESSKQGGTATVVESKAATSSREERSPAAASTAGRSGSAESGGGKSRGEADNGSVRATPVARRIAEDQGVDLSRVKGTGPGGRITKEDVLGASPAGGTGGDASRSSDGAEGRGRFGAVVRTTESHPLPDQSAAPRSRAVRREKMSKIRQRIAERLLHAKNSTAMLTTFNECDMSAVMALRSRYKEAFEKEHGIGLGFMSFFVRACCSALAKYPRVNASIDGDEIEYHDYVDISIAVSTERGLTVPILRDADRLSFAAIEQGIRDLAIKARDGKLTMDDLAGGTFTITNGGIYGSLNSTPILNPPQSGILGMHAIKSRPIENPERAGEIVLRPMMNLALSYDHRIIDGSEAVRFLVHVRECIEDPQRMLIGM